MLTYLAAPYGHPDPKVRQARMHAFYKADVELSLQGHFLVSPLYKVETAKYGNIPDTWEYWKSYSYHLLAPCYQLMVLMLDGWKESVGVTAEIEYCTRYRIPIIYVEPKPEWMSTNIQLLKQEYHGFEASVDIGRDVDEMFEYAGLPGEYQGTVVVDIKYIPEV